MALEGGLHADVPLGRDLVGGGEDAHGPVGDASFESLRMSGLAADLRLVPLGEGAAGGDVLQQLFAVEAAFVRGGDEVAVGLAQGGEPGRVVGVEVVLALEGEGEGGLDAGRGVGDDRDGAGGRDGGAGGVAVGDAGVVARAFPGAEDAALAGEVEGGVVGLRLQEAHHLFAEGERFVGVVGDAQLHEGVVPAHDAEADLARGLGGAVDLFDGVAVHVDDVVEEADALGDDLGEALPVEASVVAVGPHEAGEVERAEVAGLVGEERLFAAGVGGLDRAEVGGWVVAVDAVDEDDAGVAVLPGVGDEHVEDVAGALAAGDCAVLGVDEVVLGVASRRPA